MKERIRPARLLVAFIEALVISWALLYFGEYSRGSIGSS